MQGEHHSSVSLHGWLRVAGMDQGEDKNEVVDAFLTGFDATILEFEEWVGLLLLDALQRAGFFRAAGQHHRLADVRAAVRPEFSRFIAEAVHLLVDAGECPNRAADCSHLV